MRTANEPQPKPSNVSGPEDSSSCPADIFSAPGTPPSTTPADLQSQPIPEPNLATLIRFVVHLHGPIKLEELLPALLVQYPRRSPAEIHDTINTLLAEGFLVLTITGCYLDARRR